MHIYNKIHVFSLTLSYMFRRLLRHPQRDLCFYENVRLRKLTNSLTPENLPVFHVANLYDSEQHKTHRKHTMVALHSLLTYKGSIKCT